MTWTNDDQNVVARYIAEDKMSPEDAAAKWVEENRDEVDARLGGRRDGRAGGHRLVRSWPAPPRVTASASVIAARSSATAHTVSGRSVRSVAAAR